MRRIVNFIPITTDSHSSFLFLCSLLLSLLIHLSPLHCVLSGFNTPNLILRWLSFIFCSHFLSHSSIDIPIHFLVTIHFIPFSLHNSSLLTSHKLWTSLPILSVEIEYLLSPLFIQELLRIHLLQLCQQDPNLSLSILLFTTVLSIYSFNIRSIGRNDESETIIYSFKRSD